jgi:hypothetical protein
MDAEYPLPRDDKTLFEVGIVLVHGIGEQRQGETLIQFGEPLLECVQRRVWQMWKRKHAEVIAGKINMNAGAEKYFNALLLGSKTSTYVDASTPMPMRRLQPGNASADVKISVPDQIGEAVSRHVLHWNVQETWWGEQVIEPRAGEVIGWMMTRGPWIIGQFFYERFRARRAKTNTSPLAQLFGALRMIQYFTIGAFFALFAQIVLALFALASLIPIVQRWVAPALLKVAGVLGDAYVLIMQDLQHAAMVGRVRGTLKEMRAQCEQVVVIAHSQGSGVLFDALTSSSRGDDWTPDHVITFGAGVAKLKTLFYAESREPWTMQVAGWCALGGVIFGLIVGVGLWKFGAVAPRWSAAAGAAGFITFCAGIARFMLFDTYARCLQVFRHKATKPVARNAKSTWTDFYASHDAVAMGALTNAASAGEYGLLGYRATSQQIYNERSWLSDHVTYVKNKYEFCAPIVDALLRLSGVAESNLPARSSKVLEAHRSLSMMRGMFEHFFMYAVIAYLPFLPASTEWKDLKTVREISKIIDNTCFDWLPHLLVSPMCRGIKSLDELTSTFIAGAWALVGVALYALSMRALAILQSWWRTEIANRALQGKALTDVQHHWVVGLMCVIYLIPFLAISCFYQGPWPEGWWLLGLLYCIASLGLLGIGAKLAWASSIKRKQELDEALIALGPQAR